MDVCHNPSCGHARTAHEHFRDGSDCSLCDCESFRLLAPAREIAHEAADVAHQVVDAVEHIVTEALEHAHRTHDAD